MNIKEIVKDQKKADFVMCCDQELWYKTREEQFDFPVPLDEL